MEARLTRVGLGLHLGDAGRFKQRTKRRVVAELGKLCREAFETWTDTIAAALAAAGAPKARTTSLALLSVTARAYRDIKPLMTVGAELEAVLTAALPRRRRK